MRKKAISLKQILATGFDYIKNNGVEAMAAILETLTLSDTARVVKDIDKTEVRREKLLCNLAEQGDIAKAMLEGKEYVAVREVAQRDANGNTVFVEK